MGAGGVTVGAHGNRRTIWEGIQVCRQIMERKHAPLQSRRRLLWAMLRLGSPTPRRASICSCPGDRAAKKKTREDLALACPGGHTRDGVPIKHRTGSGAFPANTEPDLDVDPGPIPRVHPSP